MLMLPCNSSLPRVTCDFHLQSLHYVSQHPAMQDIIAADQGRRVSRASEGITAAASAAGMAISAVKRRHASKLRLPRLKSASLADVLMQLCCLAHACLLPAVRVCTVLPCWSHA